MDTDINSHADETVMESYANTGILPFTVILYLYLRERLTEITRLCFLATDDRTFLGKDPLVIRMSPLYSTRGRGTRPKVTLRLPVVTTGTWCTLILTLHFARIITSPGLGLHENTVRVENSGDGIGSCCKVT